MAETVGLPEEVKLTVIVKRIPPTCYTYRQKGILRRCSLNKETIDYRDLGSTTKVMTQEAELGSMNRNINENSDNGYAEEKRTEA